MLFKLFISFVFIILSSCASSKKSHKVNVLYASKSNIQISTKTEDPKAKTSASPKPMLHIEKPLDIDRKEFINYAKGFLNVPYLYASSDPAKGFDCSGFLFHVFKYFNVKAPRSSYNYENVGKDILVEKSKPGDLILFTASDSTKIGHIGIITDTSPKLSFIHASTGKGVIISPLSGYYQKHFVKVIRVLK